jgi:transposase InsO family protein
MKNGLNVEIEESWMTSTVPMYTVRAKYEASVIVDKAERESIHTDLSDYVKTKIEKMTGLLVRKIMEDIGMPSEDDVKAALDAVKETDWFHGKDTVRVALEKILEVYNNDGQETA